MDAQLAAIKVADKHGWYLSRVTDTSCFMSLFTARGLHSIVIRIDPYGIVTRV